MQKIRTARIGLFQGIPAQFPHRVRLIPRGGRMIDRSSDQDIVILRGARTPFGDFGGALLVGNFGDGRIHAYDPSTGRLLGTVDSSPNHPVVIDGLWGLSFGAGATANTNSASSAPSPECGISTATAPP